MTRPLSAGVHDALTGAIDRVLYSRGLHEGTIDEICTEAGVGKPALYRHFGSREALLVDYLQRRRDDRRTRIEAAVAAAGPSRPKRLLAVVDWIADWIESEEFVGCGFHRALIQRPPTDDHLLDIALLQKRWLQDTLAAELPQTAAGRTAARHLFLLIEGAMAAAMYEPGAPSAADLRRLGRALIPR